MTSNGRHRLARSGWASRVDSRALRDAMSSILLVMCPKTGSKGTGFVLKSGCAVTAAHVVDGCKPRDIVAVDASGNRVNFSHVVADAHIDLALLKLTRRRDSGLELASERRPELGMPVCAWGFPFGYLGPAPLLSVGHIAGYSSKRVQRRSISCVVVNGAFNIGNSGGPLCSVDDMRVVGVVAGKHIPMNPFVDSALKALADNKAGPRFLAVNARGRSRHLTQSEIVAEVFAHYRDYLQVMIGEAVAAREVSRYLSSHSHEILPPSRPRAVAAPRT
jgi:trypsin-like peptidase